MRFKARPLLKSGDKRIIRRFLIIPVCIGDEIRWLEWATIEQTWYCYFDGSEWNNTRFVEDQ